jgi:hypothetical protein
MKRLMPISDAVDLAQALVVVVVLLVPSLP